MYDITDINNFAKTRHQEMVNEAVLYRRFPRRPMNGVQAFGKLLISVGQKLKGQPTVKVRPALTLK
ncbi:MAG: hypothetical protein AAF629_00195 [Chloroflexota bacterium]